VVRHAQAAHVEVLLSLTGPAAVLEVRDDGVGLPPGVRSLAGRLADGHIGLAAQRVRIEEAGGTLLLAANTPTGTAARVTVPLDRERAGGPAAHARDDRPGDGTAARGTTTATAAPGATRTSTAARGTTTATSTAVPGATRTSTAAPGTTRTATSAAGG
jgi:two-component system NarL family sensor kinase